MAGVFLYDQLCVQMRPAGHGIELLRHGAAVFVLGAAEDPKRNVLLPERLKNGLCMLLQDRDPRTLQNQQVTAPD